MSFENLLYEAADGVALVTINRPDKLNALSGATIAELTEVFRRIQSDPEVGTAILIGAGDRSFVAGADIAELARMSPTMAREAAIQGQQLTRLIETLGKPVIAAINGFCLGGGMELAMACSIRLSHPKALLGQPEVKLGLIPGYGGTQRLPRLVGRGKALELILSGEPISGEEAHRIGLVDRLVTVGELPEDKKQAAAALRAALLEEAQGLASTILQRAPIAVRYALEGVNQGLEMPLAEALSHEAGLFGLCFATEDFQHGTQAFLNKQNPQFKGQ